jgi:hypothetical protein
MKLHDAIRKETRICVNDSNQLQSIDNVVKDIHQKLFGFGSANAGKVGEATIESILLELFPTYEFSHREQGGDFILSSISHKFAIEVKNYSSPVPQREVDKFIRDIQTLDCDGIFISKNGICGKENFVFENVGGKFIIYVIGFEKKYIAAAHSLIMNIPRDLQKSLQFNEDEEEKIIADHQQLEQTKATILKNAQNIVEVTCKMSFDSVKKIVGEKIADPLKCSMCEKTYKSTRGLKNHMTKVHCV